MAEVSLYDVMRPFVWVAAFAFSLGFAGYLAVSASDGEVFARAEPPAVVASASTTAL